MKAIFEFSTVRILAFSLFASAAMAADNVPKQQSFVFNQTQAATIAPLNFCTVSASTETYNHFYGSSTHSERGSIVCENDVAIYFGGEVAARDGGNRTDAILANLVGQMQTLGFKVVSCENKSFRPTCRLAKAIANCSAN